MVAGWWLDECRLASLATGSQHMCNDIVWTVLCVFSGGGAPRKPGGKVKV